MTTSDVSEIELEHIDCPLCGHSEHRFVVECSDYQWCLAGRFTVVECASCQHRYMNPRPAKSSLPDCYPAAYGPHQLRPQQSGDSVNASQDDLVKVVKPWYLRYLPLKYIPGLRSFFYWLTNERSHVIPAPFSAGSKFGQTEIPRAFELGCAAGAYLALLKDKGWEVIGVEPGDGPVQLAQAAGLNVHHGTLDDAALDIESFDFVASWMVIEHVPDPRQTLNQLFRLLKPEGLLAISVPNAGSWEPRIFGECWHAWDLPRHLHHFSPHSICRLLQECGFRNVQITHQRTLLNIFGSIGIWLTRNNPSSRIGNWFLRYPESPMLLVQLVAAPIAQLLAFFRQSGRITVTAVRESNDMGQSTGNRSDVSEGRL